ncbi:hypothetical protein [Pseudonocardia sp. WMMC193]|uniref:hypothetical protein n=1 Tax=Pseudonocardia sp. WMMC193 TaxID=2911965 RepID=UPI001F3252E8|nr:hypothetical protein [Pseudonocardia sp. WMMC193]MCF7553351.1 hypothetical protein [Pseudonocardia sp. WMMC193]
MATDPPAEQSGAFEVVRRGYARDQVDALVRELERRAQVAENGRRMAEQHAAAMAEDLRVLRAGTAAEGLPVAPQSFGFRAEKVVRLAEREAAELRAAAQRDVDAILEAGMREVAELRAAATREAADLMERAHADAAAARADADAERAAAAAGRAEHAAVRAQVERSGAELRALRAAVRTELARVHDLLGAQLKGLAEPLAGPSGAPTDAPRDEAAADAPDEQAETGVLPVAPRAEGETTRPVWTATPGTADLFDTPPRPAPRVPEPRAESSDNRHSLRSG